MDIQHFMDDFMTHDDINLLTRDVYELFGCPVMIVDFAFRALSWYRPADFHDPMFQGSINRGTLTYETSSFLTEHGPRFVTLTGTPWQRRFAPLLVGSVPMGYLILVDISGKLGDFDPELFRAVESALAKQLQLETGRRSQALNTEEAVLTHLLGGKFASEAHFRLQAEAAGLIHFEPKRIVLANLELYHGSDPSENTLRSAILNLFPRSKPLLYDHYVVFFLNSDPDIPVFYSLARQFNLRIVISAPMESLFTLPGCFGAAREIMEYLLERCSHPFCAMAERYHMVMMLRTLQNRSDLVDPRIRHLWEQDERDQSAYCLTLFTYLSCHHSLQETCSALFTHRNTVLYRVKRLKEDFGLPLDDPDMHLSLLLSTALMLFTHGSESLFAPMPSNASLTSKS